MEAHARTQEARKTPRLKKKLKQPEPGKPFAWTLGSGFVPAATLFACGTAYRCAAAAVLPIAVEADKNENSLAAHPLVFLYRHALEAYIKGILYDFGGSLNIEYEDVLNRGHNLCEQMVDLDRLSTSIGKPLSRRSISTIHRINNEDPGSTRFRYDEEKQYRGTFNIKHFSDEMQFALDELEELYSILGSSTLRKISKTVR